jgi:diguanylate cyclase
MRYTDSPHQSAEYLRLVIPLFSRHSVAANPINYAVWYEYVCGKNTALKLDIDSLLKHGKQLSDEEIEALYMKHVSECDEQTMERLHLDMRRLLSNISDLATQTDDETSRFDDSLVQYGNRLDTQGLVKNTLKEIIDGLLGSTRSMRHFVSSLQERLHQSKQEVDALRKELKRVSDESITDPLTGLINRKGLFSAIEEAISYSDRMNHDPCLMMIDVDHFKRVNDSYGHLLGDKVLQFIGKTLQQRIKGNDTAARFGGEEFCVLLPETPLAGAHAVANDIRKVIEQGRIRRMDDKQPIDGITVSIGVAEYRPVEPVDAFINRADQALYISKQKGRNRVTVESP